jgi:hypothetical protein
MHVKRGRLFGVKRTETDEIVATLAQWHVLPDKARDINAGSDFAKCSLIVSHRNGTLKGLSSARQRIPSREQ